MPARSCGGLRTHRGHNRPVTVQCRRWLYRRRRCIRHSGFYSLGGSLCSCGQCNPARHPQPRSRLVKEGHFPCRNNRTSPESHRKLLHRRPDATPHATRASRWLRMPHQPVTTTRQKTPSAFFSRLCFTVSFLRDIRSSLAAECSGCYNPGRSSSGGCDDNDR
jgi:hypothetical protein